jgi:hypothetical protein
MPALDALQLLVYGTATPAVAARRIERWRRLAAVAAAVIVVSGGTAYATSRRAPREVRVVAHAIKLPVESPDVTDARQALDELDAALGAVPVRLDRVRAAVADVERELGELTPADRAGLALRATTLLERARALLAPPPPPPVPAVDDRSGSADDRGVDDDGVDARELDDSSGSGSSGSSGSGSSGSDDDGADDRSGSSSGSGSDSSGSGTSGSDSVETDDLDGTSGSDGSTSGSSGSGSDDSSGHGGSGSSDDD